MAITPGQSLQKVIPAYIYTQYADDDDIQAFFGAFNAMAQPYVDFFNQISLPVYTGQFINSTLLDWVGLGLYNIARPYIPSGVVRELGPFNTYAFNVIAFGARKRSGTTTFTIATDDIYKRILTWHHYRGDGRQFTITWLKKRIARFLNGANGTDSGLTGIEFISIQVTSGDYLITITPSSMNLATAQTFQACVNAGILELPFPYTFTVAV
jgi:hypothetical protein